MRSLRFASRRAAADVAEAGVCLEAGLARDAAADGCRAPALPLSVRDSDGVDARDGVGDLARAHRLIPERGVSLFDALTFPDGACADVRVGRRDGAEERLRLRLSRRDCLLDLGIGGRCGTSEDYGSGRSAKPVLLDDVAAELEAAGAQLAGPTVNVLNQHLAAGVLVDLNHERPLTGSHRGLAVATGHDVVEPVRVLERLVGRGLGEAARSESKGESDCGGGLGGLGHGGRDRTPLAPKDEHSANPHNTQCVITDDDETNKGGVRVPVGQLDITFGAAVDDHGCVRLGVYITAPNDRGGEVEEWSEFLDKQIRTMRADRKRAKATAKTNKSVSK